MVFTCELLNYVDKPMVASDHTSMPLMHTELLKLPTLLHSEREGTGFFPGAVDMGAQEGVLKKMNRVLKRFNLCEGITAQLQVFGGQTIVDREQTSKNIMAARLAANQRAARRFQARKRADIKNLLRVENIASKWVRETYSTFSTGGRNSDGSGGGKYDYTSRTTFLGWKRKEEEDDDDFDQFAPDNSACTRSSRSWS